MIFVWTIWALMPFGELEKLAIVDFDATTLITNLTEVRRSAMGFNSQEESTDAIDALTIALMTALERELQVQYNLVERRKLATIRDEQALIREGDFEELPPELLGKMARADYILTGTITEFVIVRRQIGNHPYLKGKITSREFLRYQVSATFRFIHTATGKVVVVDHVSAIIDSNQLRNQGYLASAYRDYLCRELANQIQTSLRRGRLAMQ